MSRILLKSNNSLIFAGSQPCFKTGEETGVLFGGVQNSSFSFNMERQNNKQLGSKTLQVYDINRHPDVDLSIDYMFSPSMINEQIIGLGVTKGKLYEDSDFFGSLDNKSNNFYFYNAPDGGEDAIEYFKSGEEVFPSGGEIISFGNSYLTNYSLNFELGSLPIVSTQYKCSNVKADIYNGQNIDLPAINLQSGNSVGVGNINIKDSLISGKNFGYGGYIENVNLYEQYLVAPNCSLSFELDNIQLGGQSFEGANHRIQSISISAPVERVDFHGLGSDYVYDRKIKKPTIGTVEVSSLVSKYETGFISGLLSSEDFSSLSINVIDTKENFVTDLIFEELCLESSSYQMQVNGEMFYSASFSFKNENSSSFNAWAQEITSARLFDITGGLIQQLRGVQIPDQWAKDITGAFGVDLGTSTRVVGTEAFEGCYNITGDLELTSSITSILDSSFKDCYGFTGDLNMPLKLVSVGDRSFENCTGFNGNINMNNSLLNIGNYTFNNCINLSGDLKIGDNVQNIGIGCFSGCSGFSGNSIIMSNTPNIQSGAFYGITFNDLIVSSATKSINDNQSFEYFIEEPMGLILSNGVLNVGDYAFDNFNFTGGLALPNSITGIGDYSFNSNSGLSGELTLGNNLTSIGNNAFSQCGFNGSLNIPNKVQTIKEEAFSGCGNFDGSLILGENLRFIKSGAFKDCDSFTGGLEFQVNISGIGARAFENCSGFNGDLTIQPLVSIGVDAFLNTNFENLNTSEDLILIEDGDYDYFSGYTGGLKIGSITQTIGSGSFDGFSFSKGLNIPISVKEIKENAFANSSKFTGNLVIPDNVVLLSSGAFENCSGFDGFFDISNSLVEVSNNAFLNCNQLTGDLNLNTFSLERLNTGAFENCSSFNGSISLGSYVTRIEERAFANCSSLVGTLTIPSSTNFIGKNSFSGCSSFNGDLAIANSVLTVGSGAFADCSSLSGSLVAGDVTDFALNAFENCSFTNLTIGGDVDVVSRGEFDFYNNLESQSSLTIQDGVNYIDDYAFSGSQFVGSLNLAGSLSGVGYASFADCNFNRQLILGSGISFVKDYAFYNCSNMFGELRLPGSIETLGDNAFRNNSSMLRLFFEDGIREIGSGCFSDCSSISNALIIPSGVDYVKAEAFSNCISISEINIQFVEKVGKSAFENCSIATGSIGGFEDIEDRAFLNCTNLSGSESGSLPLSATGIGEGAFSGCVGFGPNLDITEAIYVGDRAFENCVGLTGSLTATKIDSISDLVFSGCGFTNLNAIGRNTEIESGIYNFYTGFGLHTGSSLSIGTDVATIYSGAFEGFGFTGDLELSYSTVFVGSGAFKDCTGIGPNLSIESSEARQTGIVIGADGFKNCQSLTGTLTIGPEHNSGIDSSCFSTTPFSTLEVYPGSESIKSGDYDYFSSKSTNLEMSSGLLVIGDESFLNYSFIGDLILPITVEDIGARAFNGCNFDGNLSIPTGAYLDVEIFNGNSFAAVEMSGLNVKENVTYIKDGDYTPLKSGAKSLLLHSGVSGIGNSAFEDFGFLTGILSLPDASGGINIGDRAFFNCSGFDTLRIHTGNNIGVDAFLGCDFTELSIPISTLISGQGVVESGDYFWYKDYNLDQQSFLSFYTGSEVTYELPLIIDDNAFSDFNFTGSLYFPTGVGTIGSKSFYGCDKFAGDLIMDDVFVIGDQAFENCSGFDGELELYSGVYAIGSKAFFNCDFSSIKEVEYGALELIGDQAFSNLNQITGSMILPSVTNIGARAFEGCSNLNGDLDLGNQLGFIGFNAFNGCNFKSLRIGNNYSFPPTFISPETFVGCNFTDLTIDGEAEEIGRDDFSFFESYSNNCRLTIEEGVQEIEDNCFEGFNFIGTLELPSTMTYVGYNAFNGCNFTRLTFDPQSALSIMDTGAFAGNNSLNGTVVFPQQLSEIGVNCFSGCVSLDNIKFNNSLSFIDSGAFQECSSITGLVLTSNLNTIEEKAFYNCLSINVDLPVPESMEYIGSGAFEGCTSIGDVYVNSEAFQTGSLLNGPIGDLYVTASFLPYYGGTGATFDGLTVNTWSNYPEPTP